MGTMEDPYIRLTSGGRITNRFSVLAVINTRYKERYADLIKKYQESFNADTKLEQDRLHKELVTSQDYINFYNTVNQSFKLIGF